MKGRAVPRNTRISLLAHKLADLLEVEYPAAARQVLDVVGLAINPPPGAAALRGEHAQGAAPAADEVAALRAERTMFDDLEDAARDVLKPGSESGAVELRLAIDRLDAWRSASADFAKIGIALEDSIGQAVAGWMYASQMLKECAAATGADGAAERHMADVPEMVRRLREELGELRARLAKLEVN